MGYHIAQIQKGTFGELSKIQEELDELKDAMDQKAGIMALVELSDLYGAMEGFLNKYFPGMSMVDVVTMAALTKKAFKDGSRQ